jgi:hypothetical protein
MMHLHPKTFERAFDSIFIVALWRITVNSGPSATESTSAHWT